MRLYYLGSVLGALYPCGLHYVIFNIWGLGVFMPLGFLKIWSQNSCRNKHADNNKGGVSGGYYDNTGFEDQTPMVHEKHIQTPSFMTILEVYVQLTGSSSLP